MNAYPRVLTAQDISCVGQCSLTIALPVISACGCECCVLLTAVLSAHTGFAAPAIRQLERPEDFLEHWRSNGIRFDGIYTGYLGNLHAIEALSRYARELLAPGGVWIADPAMADNGKLYRGLGESYAEAMAELCSRADILLPNATEQAMLPETNQPRVLTGVEAGEKIGILLRREGGTQAYFHEKIPGRFSGTGDLFAAALTGCVARGMELWKAACLAEDFTLRCIRKTAENPAHAYGIRFEPELGWLAEQVNSVL